MRRLEISSTKQSGIVPKWIALAFLGVSLLGFLDATYLTTKHYLGATPTCSIVKGCDSVLTSRYATIGDIPVALLGAIYYISIFLLVITYLDTKRESILNYTARFTVVGFVASLWFVYLQLFVIKAICLYCMGSAATSTILFISGMFVLKRKSRVTAVKF